ncbi:MAG: hypothetical protein RIR48_109 [Bacteroidota bacterium]|jgi:arylsulfatase A-like enzyme
MLRYGILMFLVGLLGYACAIPKKQNSSPRKNPNIVLILVDDLGWADVGYNGNPYYQTPFLDSLSRVSFQFTNGYAAASNCAPSRACLLTGLNTPNHGIYTVGSSERGKSQNRMLIPVKNNEILHDSFKIVPEYLKNKDYVSAIIGKWHLSNDPKSQGFDFNIGGNQSGHPESYFSPYNNPNLSDGSAGEYLTDRLTNEAISFINLNKKVPFFLYLPFYGVHTPLQCKKDLVDKYTKIIGKNNKSYHATYGAMVENMDENIKKIVYHLKDNHLLDNTLLIITSDNGGLSSVSSQKPLKAGKGSYYDGGIRVPLLIKWDAFNQMHKKLDNAVTGLDIAPTILEAAGVSSHECKDGNSLIPLLTNSKTGFYRDLFWYFPIYLQKVNAVKDDARDTLFRTTPGAVILSGDWKLHHYFEKDEIELYNLRNDPGERINIDDKHKVISSELLKKLNDWLMQKNVSNTLRKNPEYVEN